MKLRPAFVAAGFFALGSAVALPLAGHRGAATAQTQFLPADHVILKSARDVDPKAQTAVVKLHKVFHGQTVWYILTDTSDLGVSRDLDAHYAAKLANVPIGCPECVTSTVTLGRPAGTFNNDAIVNFEGIPDFSKQRVLTPGPDGFPPAAAAPERRRCANIRRSFKSLAACRSIYNAPIVARRRRPVRRDSIIRTRTTACSRIDTSADVDGPEATFLLARGFDSGEPILYLSTDASDPGAATVRARDVRPAPQQSAVSQRRR